MAITYSTSIQPFWNSDVAGTEPYASIATALKNQPNEQAILTTLEILRTYLAEVNTPEEARFFHRCVSAMTESIVMNAEYDDIRIDVRGNVPHVWKHIVDNDTLVVTTASGTDSITISGAVYGSASAMLTEINAALDTAVEVEAYFTPNGLFGLRNKVASAGVSFTVSGTVCAKAGITPKTYVNRLTEIANTARDRAIAVFMSNSRPSSTVLSD